MLPEFKSLQEIAGYLLQQGKGILAADTSITTTDERLRSVGIKPSEEMRRQYRELVLAIPGIERYLSGVILFDETIHQKSNDGIPYPQLLTQKGIVPGIKVDKGTAEIPSFPGELITEGLDGLDERLQMYYTMGARFAKWRAVIKIGEDNPTQEAILANSIDLARYAAICQQEGIVPIVEPEVLLSGDHTFTRSEAVTRQTLTTVFEQLETFRVDLTAVILKASMVLPGDESGEHVSPDDIAAATIRVFHDAVPLEIPGIVFLSGGQSPEEATINLNAIVKKEPLPWEITFSYDRALQGPALEVWQGKSENVEAARQVFLERLRETVDADFGRYTSRNS